MYKKEFSIFFLYFSLEKVKVQVAYTYVQPLKYIYYSGWFYLGLLYAYRIVIIIYTRVMVKRAILFIYIYIYESTPYIIIIVARSVRRFFNIAVPSPQQHRRQSVAAALNVLYDRGKFGYAKRIRKRGSSPEDNSRLNTGKSSFPTGN